ncbi:MAG TPA: amino acid adenylation domain-containing protein, partial [Thermoanaerobaculia bacterium]|nr:amino acid adenylation domain-containing protein [Thermoanaerobaculia bacterium]
MERTPDAEALVWRDVRWTYRELHARANRLAHRLRELGIGPESLVAVLMTRTADLVTALMAVLKAGGAYVPLDPNYPEERIAFSLEDTRARVAIVDETLAGRVAGLHAVTLPGALDERLPGDEVNPGVEVDGENLSYIIYTSGSTGRPKGVAIRHRSAAALVPWSRSVFSDKDMSAVLGSTSICFDMSVFEIFVTLARGGRIILSTDALELPLLPARDEVVLVDTVPSAIAELVRSGSVPAGVRVVNLGGEPLKRALTNAVYRLDHVRDVVNLYGPSEDTTFSTWARIEESGEAAPSIGRPLSGSWLYLLDPEMRPTPLGVPGEVYIGGAGLSRGYLNRPELTAEKFVPDPFATAGGAGGRLYRTGDLARYRTDRQLEFLGRIDHQIKIRGYRVELGEVESALLRHPAVRDAVVVARGEEGERRLVAYVVADQEPEPALRDWVRGILPEPMVPAAFVSLAALPLTPNGKVDRKALPDPESLEAVAPEAGEAPRTPLEEAVAAIWREILGVGWIGVHDDFFELGGHSLLATRVASRVSADFGVTLSVRQIFEAATVEDMAAEIGKAGGRAMATPEVEPIPRRPPGDRDLPLSFSQERLWFLDRLEPGTPSFNIAATFRLAGELRVEVLSAVLEEIFRRHESLRTVFVAVDGVPRQRVLPRIGSSLPVVDLTGLPEEARNREAARISQEHSYWRFDLTRGPLLAMTLLRLEPLVHHSLLSFHHIVSDGWSFSVFLRELGSLYEAFARGCPEPLPELPIQYPDFALWQRRAVADALEKQVAYWMRQLGGEISPLELPTDRPRPAVQSYRGLTRYVKLPAELASRLHALSRRQGATLFMTLLAAAKVLLHRLSGQDDILVGAPIAGRQRVETEDLIGFFLNTLVLRTDLSGSPSFEAVLERVRAVTLGAYSHQDVPFEALLARLPQQRDMSRTPLFQVMFNMLNMPESEARLTGLTLEPLDIPELPSKFDLTFYVSEGGEEIHIHLLYNADLFDAARVDEVLAQYTLLLEQAAELPERSIEALSLVTARSRAALPDPAASLDAGWAGAIHDLFSERARTDPERPAVAGREGVWTYGELEAAANRLAGWLLARGVRRGDPVAIYAHRSAPLALSVLGTLKAGAAFTMLDPAYPPARLAEILRLAGARALVRLEAAGPLPDAVEAWLAETGHARMDLPRGGAAAALARLAGFSDEPPAVTVGPDDVAVLGFTSGSTGKPKGIAGRHGPLTHFLPWQCERFGLSREDRFSLLSGLAHDPLQRDLFTPFYLGATVVVPDPQDLGVADRLAEWMAREGVTVAHLTPAMAQVVTERPAGGAAREVPSLRLVLLVGDALTRLDVARIRKLAPRVTCVNLYGSTETQRAVAFHVVDEDGDERSPQVLPLGRGMKDVQLLVINREGLLAGVGEVGEIAVRSPHLAQGYLGDPALTAEKFRTNPFTGDPADRIYRTGDLGRYLPDGEAAFAGRADLQVKIRGFRIEPGEIEAALGALPGVREAVVVVREDRGEKRLVAYVVPDGAGVSAAVLRQSLRERLPVYMVPSAFVPLERLPITPNGKVDRRALPAPAEEAGAAQAFLAPENDLEEKIAAVWREVLGVEKVGVQDNFFDVGGHSLLLVRLHSRLQEVLGREISLMDLFSHPNIRSQAGHLGGRTVEARREAPERRTAGGRIAIVGMAGRFPKAKDLEQFWRNLRDGVEAVSSFSDEELAAAGAGEELLRDPRFVKARGVLEDEAMFDAGFFGFSPLQAALMDPQLRAILECSWEALEDAGYDSQRIAGDVGVYAGVSLSTYFLHNLSTNPGLIRETGGYQTAIGTDRDYLASQISYKLGLTGPSIDVQTACSTSLVAVHMACQALLTGDCDMALAGGVSIKVPQVSGYLHQEGGIDSAQGRCRAFDAAADGTVWGSGVGLVALKRLEDAEADGDTIHAVLLGSAVNNDGSLKVGFTAPSVEAQAKVIASAHRRAGIPAETITYVEAHGTGTHLGDPIEVTALTRAFRSGTQRTGFCPIGSVKTNIGHLGAAAGVASLLKTVLALRHRQVPPSLHFETPNPAIDFAS